MGYWVEQTGKRYLPGLGCWGTGGEEGEGDWSCLEGAELVAKSLPSESVIMFQVFVDLSLELLWGVLFDQDTHVLAVTVECPRFGVQEQDKLDFAHVLLYSYFVMDFGTDLIFGLMVSDYKLVGSAPALLFNQKQRSKNVYELRIV